MRFLLVDLQGRSSINSFVLLSLLVERLIMNVLLGVLGKVRLFRKQKYMKYRRTISLIVVVFGIDCFVLHVCKMCFIVIKTNRPSNSFF